MTAQWTSAALCTVLRESEWWERLVRIAAVSSCWSSEHIVEGWLDLPETDRAPKCWDPWAKPLAAELYALEAEIKSGAIYGSPDRCCICDGDHAIYHSDPWSGYYCDRDGACLAASEAASHNLVEWPRGSDEIAAILSARRLLGEQAKLSCASEQPAPPVLKVEPVRCWKCGSANLPNFLLPDSEGMRHDPRRLCSPCHEVALVWEARQVSHHQPPEPDRTDEERAARRRVVLMGKARGEDPRLIGTCVGSLDPRDR